MDWELPNAALKLEAAAIDLLGLDKLANAVRGHGTKYGRMALSEVVAHYTRRRANIREPAILIRINKLYRYGMTQVDLYDATRSAWRVGKRRVGAKYAFAVFEGVVREVYTITHWLPAGSTFNSRFDGRRRREQDRREFVGTIAEDDVRRRYIDRYVGHLFAQGAQNPVAYANVVKPPPNKRRELTVQRARAAADINVGQWDDAVCHKSRAMLD